MDFLPLVVFRVSLAALMVCTYIFKHQPQTNQLFHYSERIPQYQVTIFCFSSSTTHFCNWLTCSVGLSFVLFFLYLSCLAERPSSVLGAASLCSVILESLSSGSCDAWVEVHVVAAKVGYNALVGSPVSTTEKSSVFVFCVFLCQGQWL